MNPKLARHEISQGIARTSKKHHLDVKLHEGETPPHQSIRRRLGRRRRQDVRVVGVIAVHTRVTISDEVT
jgi:hypothetical protein